ncbi:DNA-binding protein [Methylomonas sp. AM2-LC]|uniref:DNA-binding protein n=1 Tax=Methylomonas sp. AM2-LC TaxID=3153301 RepID=UPI003263A0E9
MPPQSKILVDTNAYLRLAKTIRPLLFVPFGEEHYCLYIIPELNQELSNRRLVSRFPWITESEYTENRKLTPTLSKNQRQSIAQTFDFIWDYVQTEFPGPSKVDVRYLAYAIELNVPVVTDDQDMTKLAEVYEVKVMSTLQLLKIMFDAKHIDKKTVTGLVEFWRYIGDRPANLEADYKKYFS